MQTLMYPDEIIEDLFPCKGKEGQDVYATEMACSIVRIALQAPQEAEIKWHLPDVFAVRYGSNYVGTAEILGFGKVRFLNEEGDFREGDDTQM